MQLQIETIYNNEQLAEWFGIKYNSFKNNKKAKLKELAEYAIFEEIKGKVKIISLIDPARTTYDKNIKTIRKYVRQHFLETWDTTGFESASRVAAKLCVQFREETGASLDDSKESSFYYCVKQERDKQLPNRVLEWCQMFGVVGPFADEYTRAENQYQELTDEQQQKFYNEFYKRYKRNNVAAAILALNQQYEKGELKNNSEAWNKAWQEFNKTIGANKLPYAGFLKEMSEEFKCDWLIHGTKIVPEVLEADFEW